MRKSLESRRTIRSRITIVPNIEAPRDMSPLGAFFCPHVFPKLLIFNDLRRAARHKPLMIKHLRQNAKIVNFFLAITGKWCDTIIMTDNNQQLTGHDLLMYLMSRFNMTRQEALHNMRRAGHDVSKL